MFVRDIAVTSPKTQIQALINKIDEVLGAPSARRSSSVSGEEGREEQILEQARTYLVSLQNSAIPQNATSAEATSSPETLGLQPSPSSSLQREWWRDRPTSPASGYAAAPAESAQQVLQAIVQEMNYLRVNMMQPLREELMTLYQQRQLLTADIQRLEQQRHQLLLSQQQINQQQVINDFMQSLMGRLQEQLAEQIARTYENFELQASQSVELGQSGDRPQLSPSQGDATPQLTPGQRLQHMQMLQAQSDEMMLKLDSTLRIVFESLQDNVESYQESLTLGLEKMHGLGQQGEAMLAVLINRLAEQLGRGASYYIQSSMRKEWELPGLWSVEGAEGSLPSRQTPPREDQSSVPDRLPGDQLDRMLESLESDDRNPETGSASDESNRLIDELLEDLGATTSASVGEADFNLDDVQLPSDGSLLRSSGDVPSVSDEVVTLFQIDEEGHVRDDIADDRLSQLESRDAELFLDEVNAFTAEPDAGLPGAGLDVLDNLEEGASAGNDEALMFLDQVATDMERDLELRIAQPDSASSEASPEASRRPGDASEAYDTTQSMTPESAFRSPSSSADSSRERGASEQDSDLQSSDSPQAEKLGLDIFSWGSEEEHEALEASSEPEPVSEDPEDEIDTFYHMFDTATESNADSDSSDQRLKPDTSLDGLEGDRLGLDVPTEDSDRGEVPGSSTANPPDAIEPGLLEDFLFTALDGDTPTSSEVPTSEVITQPVEQRSPGASSSEETHEDLFSEFGFTSQSATDASVARDPGGIETISTLSELIRDEDANDDPEYSGFAFDQGSKDAATSRPPIHERYILASPDENLLNLEDEGEPAGVDFQLDADVIQRLASDLSNVEGIDPSEVISSSSSDLADPRYSQIERPEGAPEEAIAPPSDRVHEVSADVSGFLSPDDTFFGSDALETAPSELEDLESERASADWSEPEEAEFSEPEPYSFDDDSDPSLDSFARDMPASSDDLAADDSPTDSGTRPAPSAETGLFEDFESQADDYTEAEDELSSEHIEAIDDSSEESIESLFQPEASSPAPAALTSSSDESSDDESDLFSNLTYESSSISEPISEPVSGPSAELESDRSESEEFDPFESDDIYSIFEDLKAFEAEEASLPMKEQTLLELLKEPNPPSIPSEDGLETSSTSSPETDTSWSIFDDVTELDSPPEGESPKQ